MVELRGSTADLCFCSRVIACWVDVLLNFHWICFSSQKNGAALAATKASFLGGGRKVRQGKWAAPTARRAFSVSAAAAPERPLWFPGSTSPPWLDGSLPGDFGFDPLGLGSDPESLRWNQQAEIVHCRWAMLGAAGIFIPEFLTKIGILNTPSWYTAGQLEYFTDTTTLFVIELILIGWAEGRRWADIIKPGCVNTDPIFPNNKLTGTDVGYPGGFWFDPLGWGSGSPEKVRELRTKEIKNGRLAMLAVMGAWFQAIYTGTGPIDNLFAHLADPGHATVFAVSSGTLFIFLTVQQKSMHVSDLSLCIAGFHPQVNPCRCCV
ncbi:hypothetical protein BHM03_00046719 [Ensete ventricosum]|nr:hypothetical protein BHM03_00046719 [Ensete ventricosum]